MQDLETKLAAAEARLARLPKPATTPNDPAYVNLRGHLKNLERDVIRAKAVVEAEEDVRGIQLAMAYRARTAPVPFTPEELKAARAIRTRDGWHKVVRVNAKTVSVETGYSWTDRYPLDKVLEVRS